MSKQKKGGKYSTFEKISDTEGIKTYETKEICDYAFWAQNKAYEIDCATKVIKRLNDLQFLVEVAATDWIENNLESGKYYDTVFIELANKLQPILCSEKRPTKRKKNEHNLDFTNKNLGIYNNKIVCLDFS